MTTSLITGAAGFIGRHLVRHLADKGQKIFGVDLVALNASGLDELVSGWSAVGLSRQGLDTLARGMDVPDVVYHLAGGSSVGASLADPLGDFSATVGGTGILLDWLRSAAPEARLVVVSSAAVYGNLHRGPISEDAQTEPYSPYGAHKFAMETTCRGWAKSFDLSAVAVRLFSVYGPGLMKQLLWDLSCRLHKERGPVSLGGSGKELRDWTHIDDVVRALETASALACSSMPVINAGSGKAASVKKVAETLVLAFGRDPECLKFSGHSRAGDPFSLVAAPGTLNSLGFEWRKSLSDGLGAYAQWYQSEQAK